MPPPGISRFYPIRVNNGFFTISIKKGKPFTILTQKGQNVVK